jgi:hypothetical protein
MRNLLRSLAPVSIAFFSSACLPQGQLYGVVGSTGSGTYASSLNEDSDTCMAGDFNVSPESIYSYPGDFHACTDDTDAYSVLIDGEFKIKTGSAYDGELVPEEICVFPSQVYDYGNAQGKVAVWKPDNSGYPMYDCQKVSANDHTGSFSEFKLRFDLTNFDSVFIVDADHVMAMRACLLSGNDGSCPAYAFGQFRTLESSNLESESN